jgi:hypothetical protein
VRGEGQYPSERATLKRYSELKEFHASIERTVTQLKIQVVMIVSDEVSLPEFPKRRLFGSTNKNAESILNRQIELQVYFNDLLSLEKAINLP